MHIQGLQAGTVETFDSESGGGLLQLSSGTSLPFSYKQGQAMAFDNKELSPLLSGQHEQPQPMQLKQPEPGDALLVQVLNKRVSTWTYMRHYTDLLERKHGTSFARS